MPLTRILSSLLYPARPAGRSKAPSKEEIDAWVGISQTERVQKADDAFVDRALGLGVSNGMILDLNSRMELVAMKLLWRTEGFLSIGVYGSLEVAERARQTAEEWDLGDRMFFQVGDAADLKFKTAYFDMIVSDGGLQATRSPLDLMKEIARVVKPGGAILLAQAARPSRFRMNRAVAEETRDYPAALSPRIRDALRSGYTRSELQDLITASGLDRARVVGDGDRLFVERHGSNDPSSWVTERERYL